MTAPQFKLVPVEPTMDMLHAGSRAADGFGTPLTRTENAYKAMLAATPEAPLPADRAAIDYSALELPLEALVDYCNNLSIDCSEVIAAEAALETLYRACRAAQEKQS